MTDSTQRFIDALVKAAKAASPEEAIRAKAREHIGLYQQVFGDPDRQASQ